MLNSYQYKGFTRCLGSSLLAIALSVPVFAQDFHFGVKVGVPMTDYFQNNPNGLYSSATRRYTVGASAELRLSHGLGFELDALYKRMGYASPGGIFSRNPPFVKDSIDVKGNSWEFPLMLKYRFGRVVRPYIVGGGTVRFIGPVRERGVETISSLAPGPNQTVVTVITTTPIDTSDPFELKKRIWPGVAIGSGVEFRRGRFRLLPEFRYTRWTSNITSVPGSLSFEQNQAEFLLGFLF